MIVSAIVATAKNNVIGKDNDIPWYLPADLKYFKKTTLNHHIIMGRKCYESIGRPLPKRTNIVLTRQAFFTLSNALVAHTLEEALEMAHDNGETEAFIIGGGQIYELAWPLLERLYITKVDVEVEGDILFPSLAEKNWKLTWEEKHKKDEKNPFDYVFQRWERREKKKK